MAARPTTRSCGLLRDDPTTSTSHGAETTARAEKGERVSGRTEETRAEPTLETAEASELLSAPSEEICRFSAQTGTALGVSSEGRYRVTPTTTDTFITEMQRETARKVTDPVSPKLAGVSGAR